MRRLLICSGAAAALAGSLALLPAAGSADTAPPLPVCVYDAAHPPPVVVGDLPPRAIAGRWQTLSVKARVSKSDSAVPADTDLKALHLTGFATPANAKFSTVHNLLSSYNDSRYIGEELGYNFTLGDASKSLHGVVDWVDDDPTLAVYPCSASVTTREMQIVRAAIQKPRINAVALTATKAALSIGGDGPRCPFTDVSALTVRVSVAGGGARTLHLTMACGFWGADGPDLRGIRFDAVDGEYFKAAQLTITPHGAKARGAQITIRVRAGKRTRAVKRFHVPAAGSLKAVVG
jgi:hypothetical protein